MFRYIYREKPRSSQNSPFFSLSGHSYSSTGTPSTRRTSPRLRQSQTLATSISTSTSSSTSGSSLSPGEGREREVGLARGRDGVDGWMQFLACKGHEHISDVQVSRSSVEFIFSFCLAFSLFRQTTDSSSNSVSNATRKFH